MKIKRIGIMTAGGDCPGLNAVIRAVARTARSHGIEVMGIADGFLGLIENRVHQLSDDDVCHILALGGTVLGSSNKANPGRVVVGTDAQGKPTFEDRWDHCLSVVRSHEIDAVVIAGGDGSMTVGGEMLARAAAKGWDFNIIGIPKTIDNDLWGTDLTFGFQTAATIATEALDRIQTTAASHHRAMVVEVMGRNAGWIALEAGVASGSDFILMPEIPFSFDTLCSQIEKRGARAYSVVCVSEGAKPKGGEQVVARVDPTSPDPIRLGGVAAFVAARIEKETGVEARHVVLGHVQRGGTPVALDRVLGTRFGFEAVELLVQGERNRLVAIQKGAVTHVPLETACGKQRTVPHNHPLVRAAKATGVSFAD